MPRLLIVCCVLALAGAACGDTAATSPAADTGTSAIATTTTPPTAAPTSVPATTTVPATTAAPATTTTLAATAGWIGEPFDFWVPVPEEGPVVGVVGVRYDDTLNVRSGPGTSFDIIATLDPTRSGVRGTGNGWQLPSGTVWWEIEVDGGVGWANERFLSRLAGVDDVTSFIVDQLGEIPVAETMLDLGLIVAEATASTDVESDIVVVAAPAVGDLGEITIDVLGLADDSVEGVRLHIFGQPTDPAAGFSLKSVEETVLCQRGVSDGICV